MQGSKVHTHPTTLGRESLASSQENLQVSRKIQISMLVSWPSGDWMPPDESNCQLYWPLSPKWHPVISTITHSDVDCSVLTIHGSRNQFPNRLWQSLVLHHYTFCTILPILQWNYFREFWISTQSCSHTEAKEVLPLTPTGASVGQTWAAFPSPLKANYTGPTVQLNKPLRK